MRQSRLIVTAKSIVQPIILSLLALFSTLSTNLAQSKEELNQQNGILGSHFGDSLSEFRSAKPFFKSRDNRIVIVQKGNEQTSWEGYKLKLVGYVFLDEVLVRIVAIFDHLTNYDSLLNTLLSRYGKHTHEGGAYEMGHQVLRETSWITETVDLECSSYDDNYEKGVWMDIHSEPLRAVYRSWRNDNFEESKRWPLADW